MCAERVHRLVIAIILGFVMGMAAAGDIKIAFLVQFVLMIIFIVWALTDFCLSLSVLKKIFPPCGFDKKA
ncbi:MAG: hypothetical protein PHE73_04795 [Sulfurovaceae bacterium]|nr:hypothetical protein [Sulfurovaceae bacterium]